MKRRSERVSQWEKGKSEREEVYDGERKGRQLKEGDSKKEGRGKEVY
jgi:hypothetical protein